jgi:peroxiredoxin
MKPAHILFLTLVFCISTQALAVEKLSVSELLDRLTASQDKLRSLVAKTEETIVSTESDSPTSYITRRISEVKVDGKRSHKYWYRWRKLPAEDAPTPIEDAHCFFNLWDGNYYIEYYKPMKAPDVRSAYVTSDEKHIQDNTRIGYPHSPFLGIRYSDYERIDSVLRQADSILVRDKLEKVDSVTCYVIDAKAKSGDYTVWLDPEHGYNVAKVNIQLGPNNLYNGKRLDSDESDSLSVQNIRFERITGVWIPIEADLYLERERQDGFNTKSTIHHKITQITIDPDHEALGSFVPKIENGTKVKNLDSGVSYTWREGMKFVVDQWDGSIRYVPVDWSILVSVGKPLPEFERIKFNLSEEQIKDKAILLCFFDMDHRSSRNCMRQLSKRAKEPATKDIAVIAIQASKVDEEKLNDWIKKNNIPFPIGMVQGDEEKIRFTWGVRSLPWLILTDKKHIVRAEGFSIFELGNKYKLASIH